MVASVFGLRASVAAAHEHATGLQSFNTLYGARPAAPMLVVDRPVLLDVDATVQEMHIVAGGRLVFPTDQSRTLTLDGRALCVDGGRLEAAPASADVLHMIRFINVVESKFTAGGDMMDHQKNPGLCASMGGVVDLRGTAKAAWSFATGDLTAGQTSITVTDAAGWRAGDRLVIAPTVPVTVEDQSMAYDDVTIATVAGETIQLSAPLIHDHPVNVSPLGEVYAAEVLNMTRNVVVEGTPTGRAHIMLMGGGPAAHTFSHVAIRHMGPRQPTGEKAKGVPITDLVMGRYGLHFHRMGEDSRGSLVEGVVASELGTRAFVPHASHGVTLRNCIAHSYFEDGYWWDIANNRIDASSGITYDRCVASLARSDPDFRGHTISGFFLAAGTDLTATACRAFGIQGQKNASGFQWPSKTNDTSTAVWTFTDCVAHNNRAVGTFVWQNNKNRHVVTRLRVFNCEAGIDHGAYRNAYVYDDPQSWGNRTFDLDLHATSHQASNGQRLSFLGGAAHRMQLQVHGQPPAAIAMLRDIAVETLLIDDAQKHPGSYDFVDTGLVPAQVVIKTMHRETVIRIQTAGNAWMVTSKRVVDIPTFAD